MGALQCSSSFSCTLSIIQAKNMEFKSMGTLFVRYYLSAGNDKRIQLNSREIRSRSNLSWNESFSLDCFGTEDTVNDLRQENVVFELRWRNKVPVLGRIRGSQLLARAEIPWKEVFDSPNMETEKWVTMIPTSGRHVHEGIKRPMQAMLQVGMKVQVPEMVEKERRNGKCRNWDECRCEDCHDPYSGGDYEFLALMATLEAF